MAFSFCYRRYYSIDYALVTTIEKSLDKSGKAGKQSVAGVLDLVKSLSTALR